MDYDLSKYGTEKELFAPVEHSGLESEKITAPRYSYWQSVFRVFFRNKLNIVILSVLVLLIAFAYIYPALTEYGRYDNLTDPNAKHLSPGAALQYFGWSIKWILGSGASGQSTFDAIWNGSRISISLAFICAAINMTVGVLVGAIWGFSKKVDVIMMEVYNTIGNVPYILLISVMVMLFTASFWTMVFALTITGWLGIAFFIRTQVVIIRDLYDQNRHEKYPALYDLRHCYVAGYRNSLLYFLRGVSVLHWYGSFRYVSGPSDFRGGKRHGYAGVGI